MLYLKFYSFVSKITGYSILSFSGVFYVQRLLFESGDKVTNVAFTAIATIAALSALCFSYHPCINNDAEKKTALNAGENFLHSTLLIIQTLFLKYVLDQALAFDPIKTIIWLKITLSIIASILFIGIGGFAVTMAALGFHYLNKILWNQYEKRAEQNLGIKKNMP